MKKSLQRFPWFYILFTFYPLLFLWAVNISQMDPLVVIRPFLVTLAGSAVLFGSLYLVFRNVRKAALTGTLLLIAFFSYGQVYYEARAIPALKLLSHHTTLVPLYVVLFGLAIWGILRFKKVGSFILYLNVIGLALVIVQVVELSYAYVRTAYTLNQPVKLQSGLALPTSLKDMPDVYVVVLDTYMRSDTLKQDLGYDNSSFIDQLTRMGFYVASCGHPNYTFTYASIASLLNMDYIPKAYTNDVWDQFSSNGFWSGLLKNNEVRQQLKSAGYKTVAFEEGNALLQFDDADVMIGTNHPTINSSYMYHFEAMYKQTTALILLNAIDPNGKITQFFQNMAPTPQTNSVNLSGLTEQSREIVTEHLVTTEFMLDHITDVPAIAGPKFTYIHLFMPHYPYVFDPNGAVLTDPGFYGGDGGQSINSTYEKKGYLYAVEYIDKRIIPTLQNVIDNSKKPPIIVLLGDHGLANDNRLTDLLAYYLPGKGSAKLYPTISPVNSFRLIFDEYFGANYSLLPDETYIDDNQTAADPFPNCAP